MRNFYAIWVLVVLVLGLVGCKDNSSQSGVSGTSYNVAQVIGIKLSNDSVPVLAKTSFRIYETPAAALVGSSKLSPVAVEILSALPDSVGVIINPDSMAFGTRIDSVKIALTFYSTPSQARLMLDTTEYILTGTDTIDLRRDSIYLNMVSGNGKKHKRYRIFPLVHQVDPLEYAWERVVEAVYPATDAEQKLLEEDDMLMLYVNDGMATRLFCSPAFGYETTAWMEQSVVGLPADCRVNHIVCVNHIFYYAHGEEIYVSVDGMTWTSETVGEDQLLSLFSFPDDEGEECLWMIQLGAEQDRLLFLRADTLVPYRSFAKNQFPVSGYSVVRYISTSNRDRLMVLGGFAENGTVLDKRYNMEYSGVLGRPNMTDFSIEKLDFPKVVNAAVVSYADRLLLFGAQDDSYAYVGREVFYSDDEGVWWSEMDSTKCVLPVEYQARRNVCALAHGEHIYLVGGRDNMTSYSDVYVGRLRSINW